MPLSEQHRLALNELAKSQQCSIDVLIDEAVDDYLEKQTEQAFVQRSLDGETHYLDTGLHVTLDDLSQWQKYRGSNQETPYPKCHK